MRKNVKSYILERIILSRITLLEKKTEPNLKQPLQKKTLGVHIDPPLNFNKHTKLKVKKATSTSISYSILKKFAFRIPEVLEPLFKAIVRPVLEYGNPIWNNCMKKYTNVLENAQRKFSKIIHC